MKLNIVLLHIGDTFDERKELYLAKHPILNKCYESVKKEFKNDNIIVFYSYDEIFQTFPKIKEIVNLRFSNFFYNKNTPENFKTDLIRILLTQYYEDMLYIDADTYIEKGFRAKLLEIIEHNNALFFIFSCGLSLFYSRKFLKKINVFLNLFEEDYDGDDNGMRRCGFYEWPEISIKYRFYHLPSYHFGGISSFRKYASIFNKIYILPGKTFCGHEYVKNLKMYGLFIQPQCEHCDMLFKDFKGITHIQLCKDLSLEDYLIEIGANNFPKINLSHIAIVLGITNYKNENIENVNKQIEKILTKIDESQLHVVIFHDNDNYDKSLHKYCKIKDIKIITKNKNMGTLYGRIEIIKNISFEYDNEFLIWLDADDEIQNLDILLKLINDNIDYDWISTEFSIKSLIYKLVKIGVYRKIIEKINLYPGLRVRTSECNIITAALIDMYTKKEVSFKKIKEGLHWIIPSGSHQTFEIENDFYNEEKIDNLKADFEDLIQWFIWEEIDKLNFNLKAENCDHFYERNIEKLKELRKLNNNKIDMIIADIIKDMPANYKEKIIKKFNIS